MRKDLDPYVCIFDECDTPLEIYSSSKEWLAHMRSQHRMRWHCFATSHEPSFFASPGILEEHLRQTHGGHFSSEEISFLVENSGHPSLSVIENCPFCQQTAENTEEHVAQHLIQFALRSLPWPEDCYSSRHSSKSSRSAHSRGTGSTAETNREEEGMLDVRDTDWDAWEKQLQAGGRYPMFSGSQWPGNPPFMDDTRDLFEFHDAPATWFDAAEDDVMETFRQGADPDASEERSADGLLSERRESVKTFMDEEGTFLRELGVLADIFKGASQAVSKLDQETLDRLLRTLDQLITLRKVLLKDLQAAVSDWRIVRLSGPGDEAVSPPPTTPELIGTVFLEHFHKLGPAHEKYYMIHGGATSLCERLRQL